MDRDKDGEWELKVMRFAKRCKAGKKFGGRGGNDEF